ncbi:HAD hydrolase-like protein [Pelagicoccus albus]|uniref:HAD hydrolase-like protein n=1 Tax=Pelagicoccus albus TaxID=415222 RepID=A0A7X1B3H7_9BACT|nr:HAD hydrolase-like protein [Pelagicoccus albus]
MSKRLARLAVLILGASSIIASCWAWGAKGHRVVGRIAEEHLSPEAKMALSEILGDESLVEVSTWADWIRSDPDMAHTGPWHYVNTPDGVSYEDSEKNPEGDAYVKLTESIELLKDESSSKEMKLDAVRWITHLVADLHQPLHAGRGEDRGGNSIRGEFFGESTNAHRIWDTGLIDYTDYSFSELAESLDRRVKVEIEDGPEPDVMRWLEESAEYRKFAYEMPEEGYSGSYRYVYDHLWLVEQRLKQAGLRLALTLEYALVGGDAWADMSLDLHWVRNSAEYEALVRQIYRAATIELEQRVASGEFEGKSWGVALDADETILDNSLEAKERMGRKFDLDVWNAWCERMEAPAVPGSVEFIQRVKELGGKVAVVSNRSVVVQKATEKNLKELGVDFDVVLLMDEEGNKTPRWNLIESGKAKRGLKAFEIVMYFGDNIHDFPAMEQDLAVSDDEEDFDSFGREYIVLPNPVYGSWVKNPRL